MPRVRRVYLENAVYYITLEGPSHEKIFRDKADFVKYMELLAKYKAEYRFKLFSYILLSDRICLLIEPNEEFSISHIMQKISPTYTKYYNNKYNRKGHLFQKRYRLVYVEKSIHLSRVTRFIHIQSESSTAANAFKEYPYSSYSAFIKTNMIYPMLNLEAEVHEVLNLLGGSNFNEPYEQFVLSMTKEEIELLEKKLSRGVYLGSDEFISEVKKRMEEEAIEKEVDDEDSFIEKPLVAQTSNLFANKFAVASLSTVALAVSGILALQLTQSVIHPKKGTAPFLQQTTIQTPMVSKNSIAVPASVKSELNGTVWEVELISVAEDGVRTPVKDKIKFLGNSFESHYFSNQGFGRSNYTITVNDSGVVTWETMQKNEKGETVSWHGDWHGNKMEGMLSYRPDSNRPQDFAFLSNDSMGMKNG